MNIEFKIENRLTFLEIGWVLELMYSIENGEEMFLIEKYFREQGKSEECLINVVHNIINYNRNLIVEYGMKNGVSPMFLEEYKEKSLEYFRHMLN